MVFDAMAHDASVPANPKDVARKKRINRSAKLKQCKLDARREQWLSQVKSKGGCKATGMVATAPSSHPPMPLPRTGQLLSGRGEKHGGGSKDGNLESPTRIPSASIMSGNKDCPHGGSSISSGSSSGSWSRSTSDTEEELVHADDNAPFDDWEAVADALSVDHDESPDPDPVISTANQSLAKSFNQSTEPGGRGSAKDQVRTVPRAWRPDDVFRPQSLPNLAKQRSFPANLERQRGGAWPAHRGGTRMEPSSCPICYEDLDPTDSSFLPCACGFHLCLFCHKRILEDDGRCPGCRKKYAAPVVGGETGVPIRLSRSYSINY